MYDLKQLFSALFETFDGSSADDLRRHLRTFPLAKRWNISADYCIGDPGRPNDVYAFTLTPCKRDFSELSSRIAAALPTDLKRCSEISKSATDFLKKPQFFHIAFIFDEKAHVFDNGPGGPTPNEVVREFTSYLVGQFRHFERGADAIRRMEQLATEAKRKSFNRKLFQQIYLLSVFFAFCSLVIARERRVEHAWLSDQDNMTTGFDQIVWNLALETLNGIGRARKIKAPASPIICVPTPIAELEQILKNPPEQPIMRWPESATKPFMWFDEFIRLPDYVAGAVSAYDLKTTDVVGGSQKHIALAQDFLASTRNLAALRVQMKDGLQFSRITYHKET
ncbi:MAG: hypothetical protein V4451_17395 [Pseudomonadota bacterium]